MGKYIVFIGLKFGIDFFLLEVKVSYYIIICWGILNDDLIDGRKKKGGGNISEGIFYV